MDGCLKRLLVVEVEGSRGDAASHGAVLGAVVDDGKFLLFPAF